MNFNLNLMELSVQTSPAFSPVKIGPITVKNRFIKAAANVNMSRGGLPTADGHVGACQRLECVHNADLMCTAEGVDISDSAACLTYQAR